MTTATTATDWNMIARINAEWMRAQARDRETHRQEVARLEAKLARLKAALVREGGLWVRA